MKPDQQRDDVSFDPERRKYLKRAGVVAAGSALAACGGSPGGPPPTEPDAPQNDTDHAHWNQGSIPVQYSGWAQTGVQVDEYPALDTHIDADFVVVGAGLAGSALTLHLARPGVSVVTLEARQPGWGASGRNAGHVLPVLRDLEVFEHFPDQGRSFLELFDEHHTLPFKLARQYDIDCDATQSGYLNAMESAKQLARFKTDCRHWEGRQEMVEVGPEDMQRMTGSRRYTHGLLFPDGGRINPYLFSHGMIRAAVAQGARVFGSSEALSLHRSGARWTVTTAAGQVSAARVVFCTNAYPTSIVPAFANSYYPLTAYALATQPLPEALRSVIMPGGQTFAQVPLDLNPLVIDEHYRLITASLPSTRQPADAAWHFRQHLTWLHRTWPETRETPLHLASYWTGRVAMRDQDFPAVYELEPGLFGLMYFNAWGNVMAPLLSKLLAPALIADDLANLPFPIERPRPVSFQGKQELLVRQLMIPLARTAQGVGLI